jgi:hypothetical protein
MWTYYCVWACVWVQTAEIFRVHYYFFALMCLRFCIAFWWSTQPTRIAHTNREAPLREPNAPSEPNRAELVCTWFNPCCPKSLTPHCSRFGSVAAPETRCAERQTRLRPAGKSNTIFVAFAGKMQFDLYSYSCDWAISMRRVPENCTPLLVHFNACENERATF